MSAVVLVVVFAIALLGGMAVRVMPSRAAAVVGPTKPAVAAAPTVAATRAGATTTKPLAAVKRVVRTTKRTTRTTARRPAASTKAKAVTASTKLGGPIVAPADGLPLATSLPVVDRSVTTLSATVATFAPIATTSTVATSTVVTTTAPTSTTRPSADFEVLVPSPGIALSAGSTAVFLVIVVPRSSNAPLVTFLVQGLPEGAVATMSPNPTAGASELRIMTPANMIPATYNLRVVGTAGSLSRSANLVMVVGAASATTTVPSTVVPSVPGAFGLGVVADGKRLRTGGAVSFEVTIVPGTSFPGPVSLSVAGVPALVSAAFTVTPTSSKSVLWLSTTLNPVPGTYSLLLIATSGTTTQTLPISLIIE